MRETLEDFERFARLLVLDNGQPFELADFQRFLLEPFFDGASMSVLSTAKGAGKSTLLGALGIFALLTTVESDIVIAAASRDQAGVLLGQAAGFARRSPALARRLRPTRREIHYPARNGRLRVISADASTGDGLLPYPVVLIDELHRWRDDDLFQTLSTSLSKRGARMLAISTAGEREASPLWPVRQRALEMNVRRDGVRLAADSGDGSFALRELSAPEDTDWRDLDVAAQVNPLVSRKALAERFGSPAQNERSWRRFTLNQWTEPRALDAVFDASAWGTLVDATVQPIPPMCFAVDASMDRSSAAIAVAAFTDEAGTLPLIELCDFGAGSAWVVERLVQLDERHGNVGIAIDPGGPAATLIARCEEFGLRIVEPTTRDIAVASAGLFDAVNAGSVRHRGTEALTASVQGAVKRSLSQSWAFDRRKSLADPSPLMAATLALWGLQTHGPISAAGLAHQLRVPA